MMERSSGVLMPMSSLPSPYGIGTMGKSAFEFVGFLKAAGHLDLLVKDRLLKPEEPRAFRWGGRRSAVDYGSLAENRLTLLYIAYVRGQKRFADKVEAFRKDRPWVETYALYMALKAKFDRLPWTEWPDEDIRMHRDFAVRAYTEKLKDEIDFYCFVQFLFYRQWKALKAYAGEKGIGLIGDIPIYVAMDSADVWSEPQFFQLDDRHMPKEVAGVPPDAFTEDGRHWGNPLYDWDRMKADGYGWWIRRIEGATLLYDVLRIDHFRGLDSYWAVPYGDTTAKNGRWRPGPGMSLVGVLTSWFHDTEFIAEDLGYLTPSVRQLLKDSGLPGMRVMEFAFDAHGESDYLPHRCNENSVCYLGTHDNDTVLGWLATTGKEDRDFARQDLLELEGVARMNKPGTDCGNWRWRMKKGAADKKLAEKLLLYTETFRRTRPTEETE